MNHRYSRRALYRAETEGKGDARPEASEWFRLRGDDFWHSVWKRIELSQAQREPARRPRDMPPEAPRDYVVDNEARV